MTEVIIYGVLMGVLVTGMYEMLITSARSYRVTLNYTEMEQGATLASKRLSNELAGTNARTIVAYPDPPGIVFAAADDGRGKVQYNADGDMLWQKYVCYYVGKWNGHPALLRKEQRIPNPTNFPPLVPTGYTTAWFAAQPTRATCAGINITDITLDGLNPVQINLTASRSAMGREDRLEVACSFLLRN